MTVGYQTAAAFDSWELRSGGPGIYILRAGVIRVATGLLGFRPLHVWIPRGALKWSWTVDEVSIVDGRCETVLNQPTLGPLGKGG